MMHASCLEHVDHGKKSKTERNPEDEIAARYSNVLAKEKQQEQQGALRHPQEPIGEEHQVEQWA